MYEFLFCMDNSLPLCELGQFCRYSAYVNWRSSVHSHSTVYNTPHAHKGTMIQVSLLIIFHELWTRGEENTSRSL